MRLKCNGEWEHSHGVKIDTLDNPGWQVHIDLDVPRNRTQILQRVQVDRTADNWIHYRIEQRVFHIACGPKNLSEAMEIFIRWFEQK